MNLEQHQRIADDLLTPLWRGISDGYKKKYARNIWVQFEDAIRSSAYTSDLAKFLDAICQRSGIEVRSDATAGIRDFMALADSRATLRALRDDATLLVLLVRVGNDQRKQESIRQRKEQDESADGNILR